MLLNTGTQAYKKSFDGIATVSGGTGNNLAGNRSLYILIELLLATIYKMFCRHRQSHLSYCPGENGLPLL